MNKYLKYSLKGFGILLTVLFVLYIIIFIYVSVNKQKIIKQVTEEVGKKINGKVSIGSVELSFFSYFPQVSVELHNIIITDTMFSNHHHPFFKAEAVFARVNLLRLIKKEPFVNGCRIVDGSVYLFTDTNGYTNVYLLKSRRSSQEAGTTNKDQKNEISM